MTLSTEKMTARQFLMLGEDRPGVRRELVHGEIVVSPSPSYEHSFTDTELRFILRGHIKRHDLGELVGDVDTLFNELNVRRPDIIFTAKGRLHLLRGAGHGIRIAPDLCIEIISPGSAATDRTDKFDLYAQSGVAHYWIVDPAQRTFAAYRLSGNSFVEVASGKNADHIKADPFPDLTIHLNELWLPTY